MSENLHDLATKSSIQKGSDKGNLISTAVLVSILKTDPEDESNKTIISTGGADLRQVRKCN